MAFDAKHEKAAASDTKLATTMANHANNDTKCTPGLRRGAFYSARGAFSGGGVHTSALM